MECRCDAICDWENPGTAVHPPETLSGKSAKYDVVFKEDGVTLLSTNFQSVEPIFVEAQTFPCVCMSIVLDGRAEGQTAGLDASFSPNEVWVATSNARMHIQKVIMPDLPVRTVELIVLPEWFERNEQRFLKDRPFMRMWAALNGPTSVRRRPLDARLKRIAWAVHHPPRTDGLIALHYQSRALDLLSALADEFDHVDPKPKAPSLSAQSIERIMAVRQWIDGNPSGTTSIVSLASEFGMSPSKLRQDFCVAFGVCIGSYISDRRLNYGRELIQTMGLTVSEAAYRAGYAHPANFATAFKRRFGHPPSAARS